MARRAIATRALDFAIAACPLPPRRHCHRFYGAARVSSSCFPSSSPSSSLTRRDAGRIINDDNNTTKRRFNFASGRYAACFEDLPAPDVPKIREDAIAYLDSFDERSWYDDPVCSILNGEKLLAPPSNLWITKNSLSQPNGHQYHATSAQVESLLSHVRTYHSPYADLRPQVRRIEQKLLGEYAGFLIGNQCLDFAKQDGVTEIEESVMANAVERRLNDALFDDEVGGKVVIERKPVFVSCVSNFTNFLDLFRKTLRNMELGVPCVVLGRSHTVQHSYRWAELLVDLMKEEGIDPGMLTYLSCTLDDVKRVTSESADAAGMLYATCSRELARSIKSGYPNTISSTGGPNTLLTTEWTRGARDAIRTSASIECAGQCTALRHAVVPDGVTRDDVEAMFDDLTEVVGPADALRAGAFDGVFDGHGGTAAPSTARGAYVKHATRDAYFRVSPALPAPEDGEMEEYWRKVTVDVTTAVPTAASSEDGEGGGERSNDGDDSKGFVDDLARWLVRHQPISLAVNAPRSQVLELGRDLFERTSLVVTTIGSTDEDGAMPPAMTCQARPQDAECFGEFPPRKTMGEYTVYPVIIPSSTPSYDTSYNREYLKSLTSEKLDGTTMPTYAKDWIEDVDDDAARGYCVELLRYLADATAENPKRGFGTGRTALWGLQRPPLSEGGGLGHTLLRCGGDVTFDDLSPTFLVFYATNARDVELSVDGSNEELLNKLAKHDADDHVFKVIVEGEDVFERRAKEAGEDAFYNIVNVRSEDDDGGGDGPRRKFPMPGQFVSLYLPMGHVKSTMKDDEDFVEYFRKSEKWLRVAS